jgi:hypothetical protein
MYHLKQAIIRASGGTVNAFYFHAMDMEAWKVIELIELVNEISKADSGEDTNENLLAFLEARANR